MSSSKQKKKKRKDAVKAGTMNNAIAQMGKLKP
jgi:hypothetical protein